MPESVMLKVTKSDSGTSFKFGTKCRPKSQLKIITFKFEKPVLLMLFWELTSL